MEEKINKKRVSKPKIDKQSIIKDAERQLNSLPIIDRIKLAGMLKNGKINLNIIK